MHMLHIVYQCVLIINIRVFLFLLIKYKNLTLVNQFLLDKLRIYI
jgi:hypothetical protein